jgi:3-(3-hydroxy-phenyl)propionate hydroxylase
MSASERLVVISGGGPVGLLCAWMLGRRGISVRLFDNSDGLQSDPRAATTHPATLDLLAESGLADDMARVGLVAPIFQFWDRPANRLVAEFDHSILANDTQHPFVVQCEQFKTSRLLLERVRTLSNVEVLFNHEVVDLRQTADKVSVDVRGPEGISTHTGVYLIGADGGRSIVRKRCDIPFEGFTWPEQFIVLTTPFDFEANRGYSYRSYFAEPGSWCNCFKVSADGPPGLPAGHVDGHVLVWAQHDLRRLEAVRVEASELFDQRRMIGAEIAEQVLDIDLIQRFEKIMRC